MKGYILYNNAGYCFCMGSALFHSSHLRQSRRGLEIFLFVIIFYSVLYSTSLCMMSGNESFCLMYMPITGLMHDACMTDKIMGNAACKKIHCMHYLYHTIVNFDFIGSFGNGVFFKNFFYF